MSSIFTIRGRYMLSIFLTPPLPRYFSHHLGYIQPYRANPYASAAANASYGFKLFGIEVEFAHEPVPPSFILGVSGVVPARVERKIFELAGIPVLAPFAACVCPLVNYVKAVACRADKGARAAPYAFSLKLRPQG